MFANFKILHFLNRLSVCEFHSLPVIIRIAVEYERRVRIFELRRMRAFRNNEHVDLVLKDHIGCVFKTHVRR